MALSLNMTSSIVGFPFPTAYARVNKMTIYPKTIAPGSTDRCVVEVGFYASEEARVANANPFETKSYMMQPFDNAIAQSPKAQCYAWLKLLPEFSGAADV